MNKNKFNRDVVLSSVSLLDELVRQCTRSVVLIVPSRALWIGDNREVEAQVHDFFVNEAKKKGMDVVDMRPIFEAGKDPMRYYFKTDPHWNEAGHELAGRCLAEHIYLGRINRNTTQRDKQPKITGDVLGK